MHISDTKGVMDLDVGFLGVSVELFIYDDTEINLHTKLCDSLTFWGALNLFQSCSVFLRDMVWLLL